MCGICGKLNFDHREPVDPSLLKQMLDLMRHRGPDGGSEYHSGPVALGHRRLSIIDLSTGDQPMCNEDGTVWVVYNGEIYNFPELRADLERLGHRFKSTSDTEVIVHLYEELGQGCVARLNGMFAFALWDERKQFLLLARDRVGIKPLYFTNSGRSFLFASEIKSLLADSSVSRQVNLRAIDRFLTYHYLPGNETLFEQIYKLDPGSYLTVHDGNIKTEQYWDLSFEESPARKNYDDAVEELRLLLSRTVKDHMISDVPIGVLLSGGVDSTGVLRYASEQAGKPINTFTMGFSGEGFADERPSARLAAQKYGTIHQEISMTAEDFRDFLPKYVWHMEEPIFEPPGVALYFVSHLAYKSSVKVLLSGEGGDEAFGGYQNYRNLLLLERLKSAFGSAKWLLDCGFRSLGGLGGKRVSAYGPLVDLPLSKYYLSRTSTPFTMFNGLKSALYTRDFRDALAGQSSDAPTLRLFERVKGQSLLNRMLYVDTKTWLPDDLLVKADKMTMATSVELRVPLLDFRVLEFAASLPEEFKIQGWTTKRILKTALEDSVPQQILKRKKTGFPVPYTGWMRNELQDFIFSTLMGQSTAIEAYFAKNKIQQLVEMNQQRAGVAREVFCLLMLELWHQAFMPVQPFWGSESRR